MIERKRLWEIFRGKKISVLKLSKLAYKMEEKAKTWVSEKTRSQSMAWDGVCVLGRVTDTRMRELPLGPMVRICTHLS